MQPRRDHGMGSGGVCWYCVNPFDFSFYTNINQVNHMAQLLTKSTFNLAQLSIKSIFNLVHVSTNSINEMILQKCQSIKSFKSQDMYDLYLTPGKFQSNQSI